MTILASRRHSRTADGAAAAVHRSERSNPFPGPRPFLTEEQGLFFGREREVRELVALLTAQRLVLVHAPSGAGKSSLIQAGVIPMAKDRGFEVLPVARLRCDASQADRLPGEGQNRYVYNVIQHWRAQDASLGNAQATTLVEFLDFPIELDLDQGPRRVVIFDQFEELFVLHPDRWKDRQGFFVQLQEALDAHPSLRVMILLRDDYLAHLEPLAATLRDRIRIRYHLGQLDARQALQAVVRPVLRAGRRFEPGAAEEIVAELLRARVDDPDGGVYEAEHADAVQLQIVLRTLWDSVPADAEEITQAHVHEHGDVDRALLNFYEQSVAAAVAAVRRLDERRVRLWFEKVLITPARSRGLVYQDEKTTGGLPNEAVAVLEQRRVIRSEPRGPALWFELTHDRLIHAVLDSNRLWLSRRPGGRQRYLIALVASVLATFALAGVVFGGGRDAEAQARSWKDKEGEVRPGDQGVVAFEGLQGQLATVEVETSDGLSARLVLEGPGGATLAQAGDRRPDQVAGFEAGGRAPSARAAVRSAESISVGGRLPGDGAYRARVEAVGESDGSYNMSVTVQDVDVVRSIGTGTVGGSIMRPGEVDIYTFDGRAGEVVRVRMSGRGDLDSLVRLSAPSGQVWLNDDSGDSGDSLLVKVLPEDGRYEVQATSADDEFGGEYRLSLETEGHTELAPGSTTGRLADSSASALYTLHHPVPGPFLIRVVPSPGLDTAVALYDDEGPLLDVVDDREEGVPDRIAAVTSSDSTYLLVITSAYSDGEAGSFAVSLDRPQPSDLPTSATGERTAQATLEPAEVGDVYRFEGAKGDVVTLLVKPTGEDDLTITLFGPDGILLGSSDGDLEDEEELLSHRLQESGTYLIVIEATEVHASPVPYRVAVVTTGAPASVVSR